MVVLEQIAATLVSYMFVLSISGVVLCWRMEKRRLFWVRILLYAPFVITFRLLFHYGLLEIYMLPHAIIYVLSALILFCCFRINILQAFFFQSVAYLFEHIFSNMKSLLSAALKEINIYTAVTYNILAIILMVLLMVVIWFALSKRVSKYNNLFADYKLIFITFIIVNLIYTIVISDLLRMGGYSLTILNCFRIVICAALVALPFLVFKIINDRLEKQALESILVQSAKQHEMSKENIEAINMRCHDLKHQISALKSMNDAERNEVISQLEKEIMLYDSVAKTGNSGLDVLMTEKSLLCYRYGIDFTYFVKGELLNFMDIVDIYTLLGNALDNAIEAVHDIDKSKRIITLKISERGSLLNISVENTCEKGLRFENGFPATTKEDVTLHGYGLKSIRTIAEKYGGETNIEVTDGLFKLNILFFGKNDGLRKVVTQ